ncbi:unnamed protein product, partial [Rotaria sordida]
MTGYDEYIDSSQVTIYHLIPYCRRPDQNEIKDHLSNISMNNIDKIITFNELYKQGVTSQQLLEWSVPIDIAEKYEMKVLDLTKVFYNCSLPWFGPKCQYRFDTKLPVSFDDIVRRNFIHRMAHDMLYDDNIGTCYSFLTNCYNYPLSVCLDWREICDGKLDCTNGEDEKYCQLLEMNECPDDTYRCHYGGQCIPLTFVKDGPTSPDCLDGTDEIELYEEELYRSKSACLTFPTFRCEEHTSRHLRSFPCGDGQYALSDIGPLSINRLCANGRDMIAVFYRMKPLSQPLESLSVQMFDSTLVSNIDILKQILLNSTSIYMMIPCESIGRKCLTNWLFKIEVYYAYSKFHFIYLPNRLLMDFALFINPDFICFNPKDCPALTYCVIDIGINNGLVCCAASELSNELLNGGKKMKNALEKLFIRCSTTGIEQSCSHSSLFHCSLSLKCISKHRLVDGIIDCYFEEDEVFPTCQLNDSKRFMCKSEQNKCLSPIAVQNGKNDCQNEEDEMTENQRNTLKGDVPFALLCDGKNHSLLLKSNETDETNCQYWPCNNPYVRCNRLQNCADGTDEHNCPKLKCTWKGTSCSRRLLTNLFCFPLMVLMEQYLDCEIYYTEHEISLNTAHNNETLECFSYDSSCTSLEELCIHISSIAPVQEVCYYPLQIACPLIMPNWFVLIKKNICPFFQKNVRKIEFDKSFLISSQMGYFPENSNALLNQKNSKVKKGPTINENMSGMKNWYCNRGIIIHFNDNKTNKCLCPPSYFGERCQWQNQRISLTLQLVHRVETYTIAIFQIIIMLIDEQRQITSYHEQITYVPKRDCGTKYNIYLLYPNQPKNSFTNYSIHIDIFDKISLKYLASWYLPIPFQFLPVNRIATQIFIQDKTMSSKLCPLYCGKHGHCVEYINRKFLYFCQCDEGYSGSQCNIKHNCSCSSDSYCLTSSICVCPMNKFGSKCYLKSSVCQTSNNPCQNNGICIPVDDRMSLNKSTCLCTENFYGTRCENMKNRIDIEFDDDKISMMTFVFIHFITAIKDDNHQHKTILKKITFDQNMITVFITHSFHILFIEVSNRIYYLGVLREKFIESEHIQTRILPNYQCLSINELMNNTFLNYSFVHRAKYYPYLCQQQKQLKCFYDNRYMCICDVNRFSNCFTFNHTLSYDCQGENICENGGLCFQDNIKCPILSICVCLECYYGTKCQFSTRGFVLSLDYILGYHIKPNVLFHRQPFVIK